MFETMKKLLGIIVLGLLLSGNAYAKNYDCKFLDLKKDHTSDEEWRKDSRFKDK